MELSWILVIVAGAIILIQGVIIGYCVCKKCRAEEKDETDRDSEKDKRKTDYRTQHQQQPQQPQPQQQREVTAGNHTPRAVTMQNSRTERLKRGVKSNPLDRVISKGSVPKTAFPPPRISTPQPSPDRQVVVDQHPSSPPKMAADPKSGQLLKSPSHRKGSAASSSLTSAMEESPIRSPSPDPEILSEPRSFFVVTCDQIDEPEGVCVRLLPTAPLSRLLLHPKLKSIDLTGMALFISNYISPDGAVSGKKKVSLEDTAESLGIAKSKMYREGIEQLITIEVDDQEEQLSLNLSTEIPEVVVAAQSPSEFGGERHLDEESADKIESPNYSVNQPGKQTKNNNTTTISIGEPHGTTTAKISTPVLTPALTPAQVSHAPLSTPPPGRYFIRQQHATSVDFVPVNINSPDYDDAEDSRLPEPAYHPPSAPLPWCPSEGSCFEVNNENHFTQFRHYCRIVNCPHANDPEHDIYFSHNIPNTSQSFVRNTNGYGYDHNNSYSFQSAHSYGRHM
eukprot:TRINITY_DN13646_c0_g1_i3.p1 TRINITY_DN13646_c0_g1~~TRINITY_DN13646_c0_g1_i3.p1  ORF type:complete len:508 (+),score=101.79 TRINITY_DN13646_c0_g1_i3:1318-2841(+)